MSVNPYEELAKCANSFEYFVENYVKINHPTRGLLPFQLYDYQKNVIKEYEKRRFNILVKFRQGGFTTMTVIYGLWKCLFQLDQKVMFLSKTDREACHTGRIVKLVLQNLPDWMEIEMGKDNDHEKHFTLTGSHICFYAPVAARSRAVTLLIVDEAAFIKDMDHHWKCMYPTLSCGGNCIVLSTTNGIGNWFQETWHGASEGKNMFHQIETDYRNHPEYQKPEWVEQVKKNLGVRGFMQEVECQFLAAKDAKIDEDTVKQIMKLDNLTLSWKVQTASREYMRIDDMETVAILYEAAKRLSSLPEKT